MFMDCIRKQTYQCYSTREDLSNHVPITVGLILTKNSTLRHKSKYNFDIFFQKIQIFWFPCCSSREDLSIDVSITNVGLILTKLR